ncbi:MAG: adenylyltransferase/cytidyltransferase family protein [Candidatus Sungbacteria bacterium]|nr:adenylyltransferase/cytidyltransferase family protein [Candidatus Sungbacteria bacterium]
MISNKHGKIMVFGAFDRLHPGHLAFLKQAKKIGKKLIVVVACDSAVLELKRKNPAQKQKQRIASLRKLKYVSQVILGDKNQGSYGVIKKHKPQAIGLGYDQRRLMRDLRERMRLGQVPKIKLIRLKAYRHRRYHTSRLHNASRLHNHKPPAP